jgi:DnaK suppressor protein
MIHNLREFNNLAPGNGVIIMTQKERNEIKDQIKHEISVLEKSISTLSELTSEEVQSDANDWFTTKESNPSKEINELALNKAMQRVFALRNLLFSVDLPSFGICTKCSKPIPVERLKAVPTASRCLSCS